MSKELICPLCHTSAHPAEVNGYVEIGPYIRERNSYAFEGVICQYTCSNHHSFFVHRTEERIETTA